LGGEPGIDFVKVYFGGSFFWTNLSITY
jgi:hypothetical protein